MNNNHKSDIEDLEVAQIWNDGIEPEEFENKLTEEQALKLCADDIDGKQNNSLGIEYKIMYLPIVVGVDRYNNIQDISTVLMSHLLTKEYIQNSEEWHSWQNPTIQTVKTTEIGLTAH